jgi:hypothetical protein
LPWLGLGLLDTAREVAAFDLPTRMLRLWWGSLPVGPDPETSRAVIQSSIEFR